MAYTIAQLEKLIEDAYAKQIYYRGLVNKLQGLLSVKMYLATEDNQIYTTKETEVEAELALEDETKIPIPVVVTEPEVIVEP